MEIRRGLTILNSYQLKMFDAFDWDGYAGAESISEAIDPFYGEINCDDFAMCMIVDKNGIEIDYFEDVNDEDLSEPEVFHWKGKFEDSLEFLGLVRLHDKSKEAVKWILNHLMLRVNC